MATRSRIGILNDDMTVESIYCHYDGYISRNGELLHRLWSEHEKLISLLAGGDISSLGEDMDDTTFYFRDRRETGCESIVHPLNSWPTCDQNFEYLYNPKLGAWSARQVVGDGECNSKPWVSLAEALKT